MNFSATLLTGGKSTRMGQDKASLPYQGRLLWEHQIETLQSAGADEIMISGLQGGVYADSVYTLISDELLDCGPIAGLYAALKKAKNKHVLLLAVDLPHMTSDYLRRLWAKCRTGCGAVGLNKAYEPLAAFYPRAILPLLESQISKEAYSFQELIAKAESLELMAVDPILKNDINLFLNWNFPRTEKDN